MAVKIHEVPRRTARNMKNAASDSAEFARVALFV
jgi:hypothetical protein